MYSFDPKATLVVASFAVSRAPSYILSRHWESAFNVRAFPQSLSAASFRLSWKPMSSIRLIVVR